MFGSQIQATQRMKRCYLQSNILSPQPKMLKKLLVPLSEPMQQIMCSETCSKSHGLERKTAQDLPSSRLQSKVQRRKAPNLPSRLRLQHVKYKLMSLYVGAVTAALLREAAGLLAFATKALS